MVTCSKILISRSDREKAKFQQEVFELLSQVEAATKDKLAAHKTIEKLEHSVYECNVRIEEVNRQVIEVTAARSRLSLENAELIKEVHEYKTTIDNINHIKGQLAVQLEETRRRLEDEERVSPDQVPGSGPDLMSSLIAPLNAGGALSQSGS